MPKRKAKTGQERRRELLRFRSDVAKLKDKGLVSKRVDARKQRQTRYMKSQVKKYRDVLEGRAKAVKVPRAKARSYKNAFRVKAGRVVVPVENKTERVRYNPKTQAITSTRTAYGKRIKKQIVPSKVSDWRDLPEGPNYRYTIPFAASGRFTFESKRALAEFMSGYDKSYKNWAEYVEVELVE